jgi:hypothetical protein
MELCKSHVLLGIEHVAMIDTHLSNAGRRCSTCADVARGVSMTQVKHVRMLCVLDGVVQITSSVRDRTCSHDGHTQISNAGRRYSTCADVTRSVSMTQVKHVRDVTCLYVVRAGWSCANHKFR